MTEWFPKIMFPSHILRTVASLDNMKVTLDNQQKQWSIRQENMPQEMGDYIKETYSETMKILLHRFNQ